MRKQCLLNTIVLNRIWIVTLIKDVSGKIFDFDPFQTFQWFVQNFEPCLQISGNFLCMNVKKVKEKDFDIRKICEREDKVLWILSW